MYNVILQLAFSIHAVKTMTLCGCSCVFFKERPRRNFVYVFKYVTCDMLQGSLGVGVCLRVRATESGNVVFTARSIDNQWPINPDLYRLSRRCQTGAKGLHIAVTPAWYCKFSSCIPGGIVKSFYIARVSKLQKGRGRG